MLSAQQDPFTNRIPCHLKASRVGTNSVELIWENVVEAVSYEVYKEDTLYKTVKENRITVEGLNSFDIYFFSVKARNSHGEFSRESEKLYVATAETKGKRISGWRGGVKPVWDVCPLGPLFCIRWALYRTHVSADK